MVISIAKRIPSAKTSLVNILHTECILNFCNECNEFLDFTDPNFLCNLYTRQTSGLFL